MPDRKASTAASPAELARLTSAEAMRALAPTAATAYREDAGPEFRDLLDARPDPEER